jgi:hypothetical protein
MFPLGLDIDDAIISWAAGKPTRHWRIVVELRLEITLEQASAGRSWTQRRDRGEL